MLRKVRRWATDCVCIYCGRVWIVVGGDYDTRVRLEAAHTMTRAWRRSSTLLTGKCRLTKPTDYSSVSLIPAALPGQSTSTGWNNPIITRPF